MENEVRRRVLRRLNYIDGHLKGIRDGRQEEVIRELLELCELANR